MLITSMEWRGVRVPFRSLDAVRNLLPISRHTLLLWVFTDEGLTGIGEVPPRGPGSADDVAYLARLMRELAPSGLGLNPALGLNVLAALAPRTALGDVLRFGLETAMLDLIGLQAIRPIADLLGGVIDWVPMSAHLDFWAPDVVAQRAAEAVRAGYPCVKLSLGAHDPGVDAEVVQEVRAAVGPDVTLRADADEAWTAEQAIGVLKRLEPYGLAYVEQPVIAEDLRGMAQVRYATAVPVAADESVSTREDAARVIEAEAADVLVVKPGQAGGIRPAQAIMELAREHGLGAVISSSLETGVGIAAALHLTSALGPAAPSGLATGSLLAHDLLVTPLVPVRGHITVPHTPGLGVELDQSAVDRYATDVMGAIAMRGPGR